MPFASHPICAKLTLADIASAGQPAEIRERGDTETIPLKPGTDLVPYLEVYVQNLSKTSTIM